MNGLSVAARALRYDPADGRPSTSFGFHWLNALAVVVGALYSVFVSGLLALWVVFGGQLARAVDEVTGVDGEETPRESILDEVIQARFVQLGRDFEHELPNRDVPFQSTAPPEPSEVPRENTPPQKQPTQRVENRPPDTVDDLLTRLNRRAQTFTEMADPQELEGSPEGLEEGTERRGSEGDIYRGRLYSFFRRGWTIPTTLARDEARRLSTIMNVSIGADLSIQSFDVRTPSGNPLFDDAVVQQLTRLQASDQRIPPPPDEVADQYIGRTIAVRFHGREAGR